MTKRFTIIALLVAFLASEADAQYHQNRRRGALLGGLAGAAIGVAIGDKGDNETAGALIGGAVGAIAGGTIGDQRDQQIEHDLRYHSNYGSPYRSPYSGRGYSNGGYSNGGYSNGGSVPQYYQPYVYEQAPVRQDPVPVVISPPPASIMPKQAANVSPATSKVSKQDVLTMTGSGMSDAIIIRQLEIHGMDRELSVQEVIELHRAGVSEPVITAMQLAGPDAASKVTTSKVTASKPSNSGIHRSSTDDLYGPSVLPPPPPRPKTP